MARKQTRAELEKSALQNSKENTLLHAALNAVVDRSIKWLKHRAKDGDSRYKFALVHPDAPHGGIFLVRHSCPATGQKPSITPYYLDDIYMECVHLQAHSTFHQMTAPAIQEARKIVYDLGTKPLPWKTVPPAEGPAEESKL